MLLHSSLPEPAQPGCTLNILSVGKPAGWQLGVQTDGFLEDLEESTAVTQTEDVEVAPEPTEPAVPTTVCCDAVTQIEQGDFPDLEAQAQVGQALAMQKIPKDGRLERAGIIEPPGCLSN